MKTSEECRDILAREWKMLGDVLRDFPVGGGEALLSLFFKRFYGIKSPFDIQGALSTEELSRLAVSLLEDLDPASRTLAELLLLYPVYLREILELEKLRTDSGRLRFKELDNRVTDYLKQHCSAACEYLNNGEFSVATIRRYTVDLTRLSLFRKLLTPEEAAYLSLGNVMDCLRDKKSLGIPVSASLRQVSAADRKRPRRFWIPAVVTGVLLAVAVVVLLAGFGRTVTLSTAEIKTGSPGDTAEAAARLQKLTLPSATEGYHDSGPGDLAVIYVRKDSPFVSVVTARNTRTLLRQRYLVLEGNGCSLSDAPVRPGTLTVLQEERVLFSEELPFEPSRVPRRDLAPLHHFRLVIDLDDLAYSDGGAVVSVRLSAGDWAAVVTRLEISLAGLKGTL
jgi:hypothetical protein